MVVSRIKRGLKTKMTVRLLIAGARKLFRKKSSHHSDSLNKIIKQVKMLRKKRLSLSKLKQSKNETTLSLCNASLRQC